MSEGNVPAAQSAAIAIEGARKRYPASAGGRSEAVSDVSISVSPGAVHGLLGPNGAGKTTTLKMLLGLVRPSGGTFSILGMPADKPGAKRNLGYLPEQPYFPVQLSAGEVLSLYGKLAGLDAAAIRAQSPELLAKVGLEGRRTTTLSKFSRGMLQRLGLAQAMLGSPRVLVLDEPASGLDPVGQRDVRNIMRDLSDAGTSILLSSHQLSEVESVCHEVTILNAGRVAARGTLSELLDVRGRMTLLARGAGEELPVGVAAFASDAKVTPVGWRFTVAEDTVRDVVDALDDAGWRPVSIQPTRDSLEDFFERMLAGGQVDADA